MSNDTTRRFRFARLVLAGSMLVMGACGMVYEYVLGVMGNNLMGSGYEQIFVVIGIMMFAMGLAAALQRRLARHLIDRFLTVELLLGLIGGFSTLIIYTTFIYTTSYHVVSYGLAFVVGLMIGLEIPLLLRINSQYAGSLRVNLSDVLCMDYVGALIGALLFTYVLLVHLSIGQIGLVLGCVNVLLAVGGLVYFWPLVHRRWPLAVACAVGLTALAAGVLHGENWMVRLEQRCFEDPIIHQETSHYQHLVLTRRSGHLRLYINGNLQFSSRDEAVYHEMLVHMPMAMAERRRRVLILGGGDGLALRDVLRYPDVREVTVVDIDPAMIRLAAEQPDMVHLNQAAFHDARVRTTIAEPAGAGEVLTVSRPTKLAQSMLDNRRYDLAKVEVFTVDADLFVRRAHGRFDVAILDFPDPRAIELAKLYSLEFYRALARSLAPGAILSVQSTSPYRAREVFLCIGETLRAAGYQTLPYHDYLPSFGDWGWYAAWRHGASPQEMIARLQAMRELSVPTRYATVPTLLSGLIFGKDRLANPRAVEINTKRRPRIVRYYRKGFG